MTNDDTKPETDADDTAPFGPDGDEPVDVDIPDAPDEAPAPDGGADTAALAAQADPEDGRQEADKVDQEAEVALANCH